MGRHRQVDSSSTGSYLVQPAGEASTWVRVLQPYAGAGMGLQFIPRIGQQVLVDFFDDDLDRPFVKCALYQGR
ncbi:MAG: phage baseplate assembly protein V, partial [Cryobacterium sp.]|nr:phage baseplate assembly protein V [Cryobacterium sp.]